MKLNNIWMIEYLDNYQYILFHRGGVACTSLAHQNYWLPRNFKTNKQFWTLWILKSYNYMALDNVSWYSKIICKSAHHSNSFAQVTTSECRPLISRYNNNGVKTFPPSSPPNQFFLTMVFFYRSSTDWRLSIKYLRMETLPEHPKNVIFCPQRRPTQWHSDSLDAVLPAPTLLYDSV